MQLRARPPWIVWLQALLLAGLVVAVGAWATDRGGLDQAAAGDAALRAGHFGAAIAAYEAAAVRRPLQTALSLRLAEARLGRSDGAGALEALDRTDGRLRGAEPAEAAALRGEAWSVLGDDGAAAFWWAYALQREPGNRRARLGLAQAAERAGDQAGAAFQLRLAALAHPADAEIAYRLGLLQLDLDRPAAGAALAVAAASGQEPWAGRARTLADALAVTQDNAAAAAALGWLLLQGGETAPALGQLERAAALDPAYPEAHAYLAHALAQLGRPALDAFHMALVLKPDLVIGHYLLGRYLLDQGAPASARSEFEAALAGDRDNPAIGIDIAVSYANEGNYSSADAWLEAAVARAPGDAEMALARARFYVERQYRIADRGLPAAEAALALSPASGEAHALHGRALFMTGRREEALDELTTAVGLDDTSAASHAWLGAILVDAGRQAEAAGELNRAIDLDPRGYYGKWAEELLRRPAR